MNKRKAIATAIIPSLTLEGSARIFCHPEILIKPRFRSPLLIHNNAVIENITATVLSSKVILPN
jgi:hypothetical protein